MLELPHTLVGALIATKIPSPIISLPLAFASHFLVDRIPHWNPSLYSEYKKFGRPTAKSTVVIVLDVILSLAAGLTIALQALPDINKFLVIIFACFLAVLPDVIEAPFFYFGCKWPVLMRLINFQVKIQGKAKLPWGLLTQILTIIIVLLVFQF